MRLTGKLAQLLGAVLFAVVILLPTAARADTHYPVFGASGAFKQELQCPSGSYVVGLTGGRGLVVDRVGILCASIASDGRTGAVNFTSDVLGGGGGGPIEGRCGPGEVVGQLNMRLSKAGSEILHMFLECQSAADGAKTKTVSFGSIEQFGNAQDYRTTAQICKPGEAMTGLSVQWGDYVNGAGLICRPIVRTAANAEKDPKCGARSSIGGVGSICLGDLKVTGGPPRPRNPTAGNDPIITRRPKPPINTTRAGASPAANADFSGDFAVIVDHKKAYDMVLLQDEDGTVTGRLVSTSDPGRSGKLEGTIDPDTHALNFTLTRKDGLTIESTMKKYLANMFGAVISTAAGDITWTINRK